MSLCICYEDAIDRKKVKYLGNSSYSPVLISTAYNKIVVIDHGEVPFCKVCHKIMCTYSRYKPMEIKTGEDIILNVTWHNIDVDVNVLFNCFNVEKFGTLLLLVRNYNILYFPANSIRGIGCNKICLIDDLYAACFQRDDNGYIMVNQHGKVIKPEILKFKKYIDHVLFYITPTFTLTMDMWTNVWTYEPVPALKTKPAIRE